MKTLILGLGNPILTDDGIGCRVAAALEDRLEGTGVDVVEAGMAGLDFLELLSGYDNVIVIDAIQTGQGAPGSVYRLEPDILSHTRHAGTPHDVSLGTALELGKRLGLPLPKQLRILAVEVKDVDSFGEECTPEVMAAIPECVRLVLEEVRAWQINQS